MLKKIFKYLCLLWIILLMCSCSISTFSKNDFSFSNVVKTLSSDTYKGRLTGTEGNKKAEQYIKSAFQEIKLEPYNDSYLYEYDHIYTNPNNQIHNFVISYNDGKTRELTYSTDYLESGYYKNIELSGKITFDSQDSNLSDSIFVADTEDISHKVYGKCKAILLKTESFTKSISIIDINTPVIQISSNIYNLLSKEKNAKINLVFKTNTQNIKANNIVGKISGENNKEVIVISAHFDHVGNIEKDIWNGAIDNASGVAVMIDLAKKIKNYSISNPIKKDIVFCAFNGEESGLQGSNAMVDEFKSKYKDITNLNIDSIGKKDDQKLIISGDLETSQKLSESLVGYLQSQKYKCVTEGAGLISDNISFSSNGYASISVGQDVFSIIHKKTDDAKLIDFNFLEKIGDSIYGYIIQNQNLDFCMEPRKSNIDIEKVKNDMEAYANLIEEQSLKLKLNEYKLCKVGEQTVLIIPSPLKFMMYEEIRKYIPKINIPFLSIDKYPLSKITISLNSDNISGQDKVVDKIYTHDLTIKDISTISLYYLNQSNNGYKIVMNFVNKNSPYNKSSSYRSVEDNILETDNIFEIDKNKGQFFTCLKGTDNLTQLFIKKENNNMITYASIFKAQYGFSNENGEIVETFKPNWSVKNKDEIIKYTSNSGLLEKADELITAIK